MGKKEVTLNRSTVRIFVVSVSRVAQTCVFLPVHQGQKRAEHDGRDFQSADID